jgi:3-dehydroquinate synthase
VDLDEEIARLEVMSVTEIFAEKGEEYFRGTEGDLEFGGERERMIGKVKSGVDEVRVDLGERSYGIHIGRGILGSVGERLAALGLGARVCVVSTPPVFELFGRQVTGSLSEAGFDVTVEEVPDGEESKSIRTAEHLYDRSLETGLDRTSTFVALGGGVVGDLTGFVAATFMRGVPFVQVPTTLLSMVDSSVGGKVAVNHPKGKNMIGAFHQPRAVLIDTGTLKTLPRRDFVGGVAEIIRYGAACDADFFNYLERNMEALLAGDDDVLRQAIGASCAIKARIVAADERETSGLRATLNYGHTFAHALEAVTGYTAYRHGEAVAIGMAWAARLASDMGICSREDAVRQTALIEAAGLPTSAEGCDPEKIVAAMATDKKAEGGKIRFVLTEKVGSVNIYTDIAHEMLVGIISQG